MDISTYIDIPITNKIKTLLYTDYKKTDSCAIATTFEKSAPEDYRHNRGHTTKTPPPLLNQR